MRVTANGTSGCLALIALQTNFVNGPSAITLKEFVAPVTLCASLAARITLLSACVKTAENVAVPELSVTVPGVIATGPAAPVAERFTVPLKVGIVTPLMSFAVIVSAVAAFRTTVAGTVVVNV